MTTATKLLEMKEKIRTTENEITKLEGQLDILYGTLKSEHSCNSLEEAVKKLDKLDAESEKRINKLESSTNSLVNKYDW